MTNSFSPSGGLDKSTAHDKSAAPDKSAAQLAYRLSTLLAQPHTTVPQLSEKVLRLFSRHFPAVALRLSVNGQGPEKSFASNTLEGSSGPAYRSVFRYRDPRTDGVTTVLVEFMVRGERRDPALDLLAEFAAQQIGLKLELLAQRELKAELLRFVSVERETLLLRKLMERAKAILVDRGPLDLQQAEEFLISSSIKSGRPLVRVAQNIVLALGEPTRRRRRPVRRGGRLRAA